MSNSIKTCSIIPIGALEQVVHNDTITDEELVVKITQSNDTRLFAVLYDRYATVIYNKCMQFVKSEVEAQDLTHDIFIRLFVKLGSFKGKSKFSTWLFSFTYNFCVNYVQRDLKKRNEKFVYSGEEATQYPDDYEEVADTEIFELKYEKLMKSLKQIDASDKMILLMRYQDGMSLKEIREVLEIGESAVKMRLNRAKRRLLNIYRES